MITESTLRKAEFQPFLQFQTEAKRIKSSYGETGSLRPFRADLALCDALIYRKCDRHAGTSSWGAFRCDSTPIRCHQGLGDRQAQA